MGEYTVADSLKAWEANAAFWDAQMGEDANAFHKEVIRPKVSELLEIQPHDLVLDIACGNGQFAAYLASKGAEVVAFDYSPNMIALARKRQKNNQEQISFHVIDATDRQALCTLKRPRAYDKAVCNMAVMDMPEIATLFQGVHALLGKRMFRVCHTASVLCEVDGSIHDAPQLHRRGHCRATRFAVLLSSALAADLADLLSKRFCDRWFF